MGGLYSFHIVQRQQSDTVLYPIAFLYKGGEFTFKGNTPIHSTRPA